MKKYHKSSRILKKYYKPQYHQESIILRLFMKAKINNTINQFLIIFKKRIKISQIKNNNYNNNPIIKSNN
jgi:hypothetical protein